MTADFSESDFVKKNGTYVLNICKFMQTSVRDL